MSKNKSLFIFIIVVCLLSTIIVSGENVQEENTVQIMDKSYGKRLSIIPTIESSKDLVDYKKECDKNFNVLEEVDQKYTFTSTVTFKKMLNSNEFEEIIKDVKAEVTSFTIRAYDKDGLRCTIGGVPTADELLPKKKLNMYLENDQLTLGGVISCTIRTTEDNIKKLSNVMKNELIYTIDTDNYFTTQELKKSNVFIVKQANIPDVFWCLEDLDLVEQ